MRERTIIGLLALALGVTSCAYYDDYGMQQAHGYGDYGYDGGAYSGRRGELLDPWLASTAEGQQIVRMGFADHPSGRISEESAHRANVWFRRYADTNRDLRLTDEEIRIALVQAAQQRGGGY